MYQKIKQIVKHSAVYSIGNIATKGIGIITLPIYTKYITLSDFGVFGIIEITILILSEIFALGQANSILVFNNSQEYKNRSRSVFFTIFLYVFIANIMFALSLILLKDQLITSLDKNNLFAPYYLLCIFIIFLRVMNYLYLSKLRADEKPIFYTVVTLIKIVTTLLLVVYFVAMQKQGIRGILLAYIIAEILIFLIQTPLMIRQMLLKFEKEILFSSTKFGFPLIFSSIGIMLLNLSDRYILNYLTDTKTVGLYDLGYRVAGIINMFLIMPFNLTIIPSATKIYKQPGDQRYYSKVMTYLCFVIIWCSLIISLFSEEIVKLVALNSSYWPAFQVVPIIILSYVFSATRNFASLGMFLTQNTKYIAITTVLAALLNIMLNFILIPKFGMIAAAYNTLVAFLILHFATKYLADRYYKIEYENKKIVSMFLIGGLLFVLSGFILLKSFVLSIIIKIMIGLSFPIILYFLKFYEPVEIETIKLIWGKWKNPTMIAQIISGMLKNNLKDKN